MLENLKLAEYKLILVAKEKLHLPQYLGSTLRGGFGCVFKRLVCIDKDKECRDCILKAKCVYSYIFETAPFVDAEKLRNYKDIPRPFIIEPPDDLKQEYLPGETIEFHLILIGRAIDYLPYFVLTFKELGNTGIGKGRGKCSLTSIKAIKQDVEEEIYDHITDAIKNIDLTLTMSEILSETANHKADELRINFITPTRMKGNDKYVLIPEFHIFIRTLLSRISSLAYFHCADELNVDFKQLIENAKEIKIKDKHTGWYDWERYSNRQQRFMNLGGIIGNVTYAGDLTQFLPFIVLGKYIHVGKGATFGLGRYEIIVDNER